jgi:hypothetical protein
VNREESDVIAAAMLLFASFAEPDGPRPPRYPSMLEEQAEWQRRLIEKCQALYDRNDGVQFELLPGGPMNFIYLPPPVEGIW